jgi:4-amino-4-deoxy-L-arabinose transferase-like glycosyltransferase
VLAVAALAVAVSAWAGAVGLIVGFLSIGTELNQRLPAHSPVVGGIALAVVVAAPYTVLGLLAWRGDRATPGAAVLAGVVLMGWIVVELIFIRSISFFHPTFLLVGIAFVVAGMMRSGTVD